MTAFVTIIVWREWIQCSLVRSVINFNEICETVLEGPVLIQRRFFHKRLALNSPTLTGYTSFGGAYQCDMQENRNFFEPGLHHLAIQNNILRLDTGHTWTNSTTYVAASQFFSFPLQEKLIENISPK